MAKQIGCKIIGRMDEYSFYYDTLHGYLVRKTGGVTSKQYRQGKCYSAARDASTEFATVSKAGKLIRDAFNPFIRQVKDSSMVNRLNKELVALKQLDNKHTRGKRRPETMLANADANQWIRIFQFNESVKVYELFEDLSVTSKSSTGTGQTIVDLPVTTVFRLAPAKLLESAFPESATHTGLTLVRTVIDFDKKEFNTVSSQRILVSKENREKVILHIDDLPSKNGTEIVCLQVVFFYEKDGRLSPLKGKVHSMGIVGINQCNTSSKIKQVVRMYFRKNQRLQSDIRIIPQKFYPSQRKSKVRSHYLHPNDS